MKIQYDLSNPQVKIKSLSATIKKQNRSFEVVERMDTNVAGCKLFYFLPILPPQKEWGLNSMQKNN